MAGEIVTTIAGQFRAVVAVQADDEALVTPRARYTYADLDRWSDAIANDLLAANAPVDRPVAIVTRDNISLVPSVLAVVKAGHFFVMIDAADPDDRVAMLLQESNAGVGLVDAIDAAPEPARALPLLAIRSLPSEDVPRPIERAPNPYAFVIYTSGTTGKPKGILSKQTAVLGFAQRQAVRWQRERGERSIYTSLPGFVRAATTIFGTLLHGATLCAFDARSESLTALAQWIRDQRISMLSLTPPLFRRLMSLPPEQVDLSSVRKLRIGADVVTIADVQVFQSRFPKGSILSRGYASSETGSVFHFDIGHDTPIPGPLVPIGRPAPDVRIWLVDEGRNEVVDGEVGELVVEGPDVIDGYWNAPELNAKKFDGRKFFTGDLVKRGEDGLYYFIGRSDSRLKIHGRRIDPLEVESALLATGDLREAVIVGKPDARGELQLVAYVVMREGKPCVPRDLRAALRARVPSWMVPVRIYALDAIPMTRAAKADRTALLALVDDEQQIEESGATDDLERRLVEIWSSVVGASVHVDEDFFDDLGGGSVIAAHLVTKIEGDLGRVIPLSLIVELNTVRKMAAYFRADATEKPLAILLQKGDAALPPLFCVAGAGGGVMKFRNLAAKMGETHTVYGLQPHGFDLDNFPASYAEIVASYADAVQKIQPHGPYYLSGYSSGGVMAFAMARHFELAREEVAFVGAIDSARKTSPIAAWRRAVHRVTLLVADPRRARRIPAEIKLRTSLWVKKHVRRRIIVDDAELPAWLRDTRHAMFAARRDDSAGLFTGPVTLFRARAGLCRTRKEQDLGWNEYATGGLRIIDVDGDHDSVLEDHVASLAAAMVEELRRAERSSTRRETATAPA